MGKKHKKHHKSEKSEVEVPEKPLKVVLKLGGLDGSSTALDISTEFSGSEKKHKHKKKKKKKSSDKEKRRHEERSHHHHHHHHKEEVIPATVQDTEDAEVVAERPLLPEPMKPVEEPQVSQPPPAKKSRLHELTPLNVTYDSKLREKKLMSKDSKALMSCLDYLHRVISKKDVNGFFQYPVTDVIAPGYSSIIKHPMDILTMKTKLANFEYRTVMEYKNDFMLMCNNAMVYNRPDTVYYQVAKKLLHSGLKYLTHERLLNMKNTLSSMQSLTMDDLGFRENDVDEVAIIVSRERAKKPPKPPKSCKFQAIPDNLSPSEILIQARAAADDAAGELTLRAPDSKIGFLRRQKDGTTSLNILNHENDGLVSEKERVISMGDIVGKLSQGTGNINTFREDARNKVTPVTYLNYGPYCSFAPAFDSQFSNLTKEDSDLVLSTYGSEIAVDYAKSIKNFTEHSGDYVTRLTDGLLNILTNGEHAKTVKVLEEKYKERVSREEQDRTNTDSAIEADIESQNQVVPEAENCKEAELVDFNSLRSLQDLGIDVSFLDTLIDRLDGGPAVQDQLDSNAEALKELEDNRNERLGQSLPVSVAYIKGPTEDECHLAEKVTSNLANLAKQVRPTDVTNVVGIHDAMGVTMNTPSAGNQSEVDIQDNNQPQVVAQFNESDAAQTGGQCRIFPDQRTAALEASDTPTVSRMFHEDISDISEAED